MATAEDRQLERLAHDGRIAAGITLITGYDYLKSGVRYMAGNPPATP